MARRWFAEADPFSPIQYRYADAKTLYAARSEVQEIQVLESDFFGRMLVLDGVVQLTQRDEFLYHEMLAHVPLHSHPAPRSVLIVGGGDGGTLREVLKHPSVHQVTLVELDPQVIEVARRFFPDMAAGFSTPSVTVRHGDGVAFLRQGGHRFDVILVDSTDPVGPSKGLSTPEFFQSVSQALAPGGRFVMQTESLHFHADYILRVQHSLKASFAAVDLYGVPIATYAGNWWTFALAADAPMGREPAREPVPGLRIYCAETHRSAFVPAKALACFAALGAGPYRQGRATGTGEPAPPA